MRAKLTKWRVGDALQLDRSPVTISMEQEYSSIGIRSFGRGIFHYPSVPGAELSRLRYFEFPPGALALSNIKAWEGAVGFTQPEDCRSIASNRFLFYRSRAEDAVSIDYMYYYFLTDKGVGQLVRASPGSADRNRTLGMRTFEALCVELPGIEVQREVARRLRSDFEVVDQTRVLLARQERLVEELRARIVNSAFIA